MTFSWKFVELCVCVLFASGHRGFKCSLCSAYQAYFLFEKEMYNLEAELMHSPAFLASYSNNRASFQHLVSMHLFSKYGFISFVLLIAVVLYHSFSTSSI